MRDSDKDIAGFIRREGAVGVLARLDATEGKLNGELEDIVHVSHTTLSERLAEGLDADLVELTRLPEDHGNAKRYRLTHRGKRVQERMQNLKMERTYERFFEANRQLDALTDELIDWVEDSHITDSDWPPRREPDPDDFGR